MFLIYFFLAWLTLVAATRWMPDRGRRVFAGGSVLAFATLLVTTFGVLEPWQRLLVTTAGMLWLIKAVTLLIKQDREGMSKFSALGLLSYMSFWPGVAFEPFRARHHVDENGARFVRGYGFFWVGLALSASLAIWFPLFGADWAGWLGLAALLMMVHFGYADMLTSIASLAGWKVGPLFEQPLKSESLHDFWSRRWNLAFVEMDRLLFLRPLMSRFGGAWAVFLVFIISGILHDVCISYSAGGGWGLPTLYFLLHGLAVLLERKLFKPEPSLLKRLWTWAWLLIPLPLLFTDQFRNTFILPLFEQLHQIVAAHDWQWYLSWALWFGAIGHFCTLGAGLQVPSRLKWREELAKVSNFNRKVFLNYAGYVGMTIIAFGIMTLLLHDEMMRGDKAAICISWFIFLFWLLRLVVDFVWFGHDDWPKGPEFVIGHTMLNTLFVFLTVTYLAVSLKALL